MFKKLYSLTILSAILSTSAMAAKNSILCSDDEGFTVVFKTKDGKTTAKVQGHPEVSCQGPKKNSPKGMLHECYIPITPHGGTVVRLFPEDEYGTQWASATVRTPKGEGSSILIDCE